MKIYEDIEPIAFDGWCGAEDTLIAIKNAGKEEEFNEYAEEMWPDGVDGTTFNDWLWFDCDSILQDLEIETEDGEE